jgi:hypothetical protein
MDELKPQERAKQHVFWPVIAGLDPAIQVRMRTAP